MAAKTWSIQVMFEDYSARREWEDSLPYENTGGEMETLFFESKFGSEKEAQDAVKEIESVLKRNKVAYQDVSFYQD